MNFLYITLFFKIVAGIVQTFTKSWNQLLYPRVIEVCRLHFEPRLEFFLHLIIVAWIQECGENPIFRLQSQWSPETHPLPVCIAWVTSVRNPSVSFCYRPLTFWGPSVRTIFWTLIFLSQLHEFSGRMWCNSLIVTRRSARISPSISWRRSSEIKDGLQVFVRREHQSFLRKIHGTTSSHFADS
jgi:hypothetical protein